MYRQKPRFITTLQAFFSSGRRHEDKFTAAHRIASMSILKRYLHYTRRFK